MGARKFLTDDLGKLVSCSITLTDFSQVSSLDNIRGQRELFSQCNRLYICNPDGSCDELLLMKKPIEITDWLPLSDEPSRRYLKIFPAVINNCFRCLTSCALVCNLSVFSTNCLKTSTFRNPTRRKSEDVEWWHHTGLRQWCKWVT